MHGIGVTNLEKKSNFLLLGFKKRLYLSTMIIFAIFFSSIFLFHVVYAAVSEGCSLWEVNPQCDLSGWMKLFMGDIGVGAVLALFLHVLSHRTQKKLEGIIESEEVLRIRRKDYAVRHLKNLFNTLLYTAGIINKSTSNFNDALASETRREERLWIRGLMLSELRSEEAKMGRVLISIRNNLIGANDVLEPEIVDQVDGICTFVGEISAIEHKDGTMFYPKYVVSKTKIKLMLDKLQTYSNITHTFVEPKIEKPQNQYKKSKENLQENTPRTLIPGEIR